MVYLYGIIGFVLGFVFGLGTIALFLKSYSNHELMKRRELRWTYGLAVWVFAGLGAWGGVELYSRHLF